MSLWSVPLTVLIAAAVWLDIRALRQLYLATELTATQKTAQTLIVLSIPILGPMLVSHLLSEGKDHTLRNENSIEKDQSDTPPIMGHPIRDSFYRYDLREQYDETHNSTD